MTKERISSVIATARIEGEFCIFVNAETGGISFDENAQYVRHEIRYERAKGDKVVSSTPGLPSEDAYFTQSENLFYYDVLVSIDTNYKEISDTIVGVTAIVVWRSDGERHFTPSCPFLVEINDPIVSAERLGWAYACVKLIELSVVETSARVGLIVDAHLSELEGINRRVEPVIDGLMLPTCYSLIYASADTGGDLLANRMLKAADRASSRVLSQMESGEIPINKEPNGLPGMNRGFRLLRPLPR